MAATTSNETDRIAYSIPELQSLAGDLSRTTVYREIRDGHLQSMKVGRRRVIPRQAALDWIVRKMG